MNLKHAKLIQAFPNENFFFLSEKSLMLFVIFTSLSFFNGKKIQFSLHVEEIC